MEQRTLKKLTRGRYRIALNNQVFVQIIKQKGGWWLSEYRETSSGNLIRYADSHQTLKEAIDEFMEIDNIKVPVV